MFLLHRSTFEHPDFPDSMSVIGATQSGGGLAQHYFDTRGVHRVYNMTFDRGVWTLTRKAVGPDDCDQRLKAKFKVLLTDNIAGPKIRCELEVITSGKTPEGNITASYTGQCRFKKA